MTKNTTRYGIFGNDVKINQYVDFSKPYFNSLPYLLIVQFADVELRDSTNAVIFNGTVNLRLETEPTVAAIAVFERLLHSFEGHFSFSALGKVSIHEHYAEFFTKDQSLTTNIQPRNPKPPKGEDVIIDTMTGEVK